MPKEDVRVNVDLWWKLLNVITYNVIMLGPRVKDHINYMITITEQTNSQTGLGDLREKIKTLTAITVHSAISRHAYIF
jgi:hypothetical protein